MRFPHATLSEPSGWVISGNMTGCAPPTASLSGYLYIHPKDANGQLREHDAGVVRFLLIHLSPLITLLNPRRRGRGLDRGFRVLSAPV